MRYRFITTVSCLLVLLLAAARPGAVSACTCSAKISQPTAVFVGTVIGKDSPLIYGVVGAVISNLRGMDYSPGIIFDVDDAWRGVTHEEITVRAGTVDSCHMTFERGQRYFVQAQPGPDGYLQATACSGSLLLSDASAELSALSAETTLPLTPVPRVTLYEAVVFAILALLVYWWLFMVRAIRANPLRF